MMEEINVAHNTSFENVVTSDVIWECEDELLELQTKISQSRNPISWVILGYENKEVSLETEICLEPAPTPQIIASGSGGLKAFIEIDGENELTRHMKSPGYLYWIYARIHIKDKTSVRHNQSYLFNNLHSLAVGGSKKLILISYRHNPETVKNDKDISKLVELKYMMAINALSHGHILRKLFTHHIYVQANSFKDRLFHKNLYSIVMQKLTVDSENSDIILVLKIRRYIENKEAGGRHGSFVELGKVADKTMLVLPIVKHLKSSNTLLDVKKEVQKSMHNRGFEWNISDIKLFTMMKKSNESVLQSYTTIEGIKRNKDKGLDLVETVELNMDNQQLSVAGILSGSEIIVERVVNSVVEDKRKSFAAALKNAKKRFRIGRGMLKQSKVLEKAKKEVEFISRVRTLESMDMASFTDRSRKRKAQKEKESSARRRRSREAKRDLITTCRMLGANFIDTGDITITRKQPLGAGRTARVFEGLLRCHATEGNIREGMTVFAASDSGQMIIQNTQGELEGVGQVSDTKTESEDEKIQARIRGMHLASKGDVLTLEPLEIAIKVAIKEFTCRYVTPILAQAFQQEIKALCMLDHIGVVRCLGIYVDEVDDPKAVDALQLLIVYELCSRGDLRDLKSEPSWPSLPLWKRLSMILPAAEALEYMHGQSMVHRDIKIDNILVSEDFAFKIGDFGVAKVLSAPSTSTGAGPTNESTVKGTLGYTAPEVLSGLVNGTTMSDMFSFGVVLYLLVSDYVDEGHDIRRKNPFYRSVDLYEEQFIDDKHLASLIYPPDTPEKLIGLINGCVKSSPEERYTAADVVEVIKSILD